MATTYRFAHNRIIDGVPHLIWGNGIGEVCIPRDTPQEYEALMDRCWNDNDLSDEGEIDILSVYFRDTSNPTTFYGRLYNDTPTNQDTLSTLSGEVSGTGYPGSPGVTWTAGTTDFGSIALDPPTTGDAKTTSTTKTWTAASAWSPATYLALTTAQTGTSGLLIAYSALSATRTLASADTLDVSVAIKLA